MKQLKLEEKRKKEECFMAYKRLIRSIRRGKLEKINSKKACNNIAKK